MERLLADESDFFRPEDPEVLREDARDPAFNRPTVRDTFPIRVCSIKNENITFHYKSYDNALSVLKTIF